MNEELARHKNSSEKLRAPLVALTPFHTPWEHSKARTVGTREHAEFYVSHSTTRTPSPVGFLAPPVVVLSYTSRSCAPLHCRATSPPWRILFRFLFFCVLFESAIGGVYVRSCLPVSLTASLLPFARYAHTHSLTACLTTLYVRTGCLFLNIVGQIPPSDTRQRPVH